ncbi:MAG: acyl-CoA dehydrogenase, partial [Myxococcota bacterium]
DEQGRPAQLNDVQCERSEEKMGNHASPTCVMRFGAEGQCKGWLLGEVNQGMACMFQMMNEARIGVAVQGLSGGTVAFQSALEYAQERTQSVAPQERGRKGYSPILQHPDVRRMIMTMKAYTEGIRSMIYHTAFYFDCSKHAQDEKQREQYLRFVELLTPVTKAYASDIGFRICEMAIQTYGGYGYTKEYPVEQYLRDTQIASIYEGTNGIQALDLFVRKIGQYEGLRFKLWHQHVIESLQTLDTHALQPLVQQIRQAQEQLLEVTQQLQSSAQKHPLHGLLQATPYLEAFGNVCTAFFLTQAATIAHDKLQALFAQHQAQNPEQQQELCTQNTEAAFYHNKICTARFFNAQILTKNEGFIKSCRYNDNSALEALFLS